MIDNLVTHETPEGIRLALMPAGLLPRAMAWLLDTLIRGIVMSLAGTGLFYLGATGVGLYLLLAFLIFWLYPVLFEVLRDGQTIGKRLFNIYVCMDNGMPIGWQASMIRSLLAMADFLPFGYFTGVIAILFSQSNKRLGDMVAGTLVAHLPQSRPMPQPIAHRAILPPMPLNLEEQRAVLSFVERADSLPDERVVELVGILAPMTRCANVDDAGDEIVGYANAIMGYEVENVQRYGTRSASKARVFQSPNRSPSSQLPKSSVTSKPLKPKSKPPKSKSAESSMFGSIK